MALIPRLIDPPQFVTVDEGYHWFDRVDRFTAALRAGDWAGTNLTGHPGVTTMWLGALGRVSFARLAALGMVDGASAAALRTAQRLPIGVVAALCVLLGYALLRRLLPARAALLAGLLWAADPFLIAHAQLLHLDALVTSFMMVALLLALVGTADKATAHGRSSATVSIARGLVTLLRPGGWGWLIGSGVFTGLALLTKSPAIALLPCVGLLLLVRCGLRRGALLGALWGLAAVLTFAALWPAFWVGPIAAVNSIIHQASSDGGSPHGWGNFFFGRQLDDPGPLFYPVAIALRLTPWTLIGLLVLPLALWRPPPRDHGPPGGAGGTPRDRGPMGGAGGPTRDHGPTGGRSNRGTGVSRLTGAARATASPLRVCADGDDRWAVGGRSAVVPWLLLFIALFLTMMSIPPKKFDRYALPVFPALDVLAAVGLLWGWDRLRRRLPSWADAAALVVTLAVLLGNLWLVHPYEQTAYNGLLGGAPVAARLIPVGWGEGYEQAGAFIDAQPDGRDYPVASWFGPVLEPFVAAPVVPLSWALTPGKAGYAVLYRDQVQRGDELAATELLQQHYTPAHVVVINGLALAWVYQLPRPAQHPLAAGFGPGLLRGYDLDTAALSSSRALTLTLHWQAQEPDGRTLTAFIQVLDAQGNKLGQADVPPAGPRDPTTTWVAGRFYSGVHHVPLTGDPAAARWIAVGLYDPATGARLPLTGYERPSGAPDGGGNAVVIPLR